MYDDNFGHYEIAPDDDPEEVMEFYRENQKRSVVKTCSICGRKVKLLPDYDKCNACCREIEAGRQF
jgi:hypothetical protein